MNARGQIFSWEPSLSIHDIITIFALERNSKNTVDGGRFSVRNMKFNAINYALPHLSFLFTCELIQQYSRFGETAMALRWAVGLPPEQNLMLSVSRAVTELSSGVEIHFNNIVPFIVRSVTFAHIRGSWPTEQLLH
jgi:hypothetical protein